MYPSTFGLQASVAGGALPEAWQALRASQASTLAALLSRMQTTAATMRRQQAPAAQWHALATEAERVLTAQAQQQSNVAHDGDNTPGHRRRWRQLAVGGEGRMVLGPLAAVSCHTRAIEWL